MRRKITDTLLTWKKEKTRRPLVLRGARQTGKTWVLRDFGKRYYKRQAYFHLETDSRLRALLEQEQNPRHLLEFLEAYAGVPIHPEHTLIILDEIQSCPAAREALARFYVEFPDYSITAAERLPGFHGPIGWEKADVQLEILHGFDFEEFLWACREVALAKEIREHFISGRPLEKRLHQQALYLFRAYLVTGGLPSAVQYYREEHSLLGIADIHSKLLQMDLADITACLPSESRSSVRASYRSLGDQLAKENPCFQYCVARKGSTRKLLDDGIRWLSQQQMLLKVPEVGKASRFKCYFRDPGLCAAAMEVPAASLLQLERTRLVQRVTENVLATAFAANGYALSYWRSVNRAELAFLLEKESSRIAIDLHFEEQKKSRSLFQYRQQEKAGIAYRISEENFKDTEAWRQIPYYSVFCI